MPQNQHSSVLNVNELELLLSREHPQHSTLFPLYSMVECRTFVELNCNTNTDIAAITLQLTASPLGSAVIISDTIELSKHCDSLLKHLKQRADITVFWLGKLPSMSFDLPSFIYCGDNATLENSVKLWDTNNLLLFNKWKSSYRVGIITHLEKSPPVMQPTDLTEVKFYNAQQAIDGIDDLQLLVINLNTPGLRLIDILNNLRVKSETPFLLLYGEMQSNLSHAVYNLVNNMGFSILASFETLPTLAQSEKTLFTLFSKIYLKHWVNAPVINLSAKGIYHLETDKQESTFFPYGLNQQQIISIYCPPNSRKVINVQSIFDWYPDGLKRDEVVNLIKQLGSDPSSFDLYLTHPQQIKVSSPIFIFIVMARLNEFRIYWNVEDEKDFSIDMLMFLPISDVILSQPLANQLVNQPSSGLLDFIKEAQQQNIRIGVVMEHNHASINALSLYGVEVRLEDIESSH